MPKYLVLGCGLVGSVIAADLALDKDSETTVADIHKEALERVARNNRIKTIYLDFSDELKLIEAIREYDVIVSAVPGFLGHNTLKTIINEGKNAVDIAFMPENSLGLDSLAKEKNVTAVVDCGVSPGLSNLAVGLASLYFDQYLEGNIYVGGLPMKRSKPYEYNTVFSLPDVIEEYTRPARAIENGELVEYKALEEVLITEAPFIGTLEGFKSDGLRSLLETIEVEDLTEYTLRYPGHIATMKLLRDTGFFNTEPIRVNDKDIVPRDVTIELLRDMWRLQEGDSDICFLKVESIGLKDEKLHQHLFMLIDQLDPKTGFTAMARTTGFPASMTARLIAKGVVKEKGVLPLELLAANRDYVDTLFKGLEYRDINIMIEEIEVPEDIE